MPSTLSTRPLRASRSAWAPRALPALICALFFASGLAQTAIVPMLPALAGADRLSSTTTALILALPGLAMLAVSVPAGVFADRLGPRRVTLASGVMMVLGCAAQAAPSLPVLLAGRIEFGLAFGVLWTAGAAWLNGMESVGARGVGLAVICSSVGTMVGPGIGGALAHGADTTMPFALIALASALATVVLALVPGGATRRLRRGGSTTDFPALESATPHPATEEHEVVAAPGPGAAAIPAPLRGLADQVRSPVPDRVRHVAAGIGSIVVAGALSGATQLLIPAGLHADGVSEGAIGVIFSICALGYILTSIGVVRLGARMHTLRVNAIVTALGAASLVPALLGSSPALLVIALMATAVPRGAINVVAYAVADAGQSAADRARRGGSMFGMLNGAWGAATVLVPLAAGALVAHGGDRAGYLVVVLPAAAISVGLACAIRPGERPAVDAMRGRRRLRRGRYRDVCDGSPATSAEPSTTWSRRSSSSGM